MRKRTHLCIHTGVLHAILFENMHLKPSLHSPNASVSDYFLHGAYTGGCGCEGVVTQGVGLSDCKGAWLRGGAL